MFLQAQSKLLQCDAFRDGTARFGRSGGVQHNATSKTEAPDAEMPMICNAQQAMH
jgi:hypothetical protein